MKNLSIALLYGGTSSEREISLLSGKNIGEALAKNGHKVDYIDTKYKEELSKFFSNKYDVAYLGLHGKGGEDGVIQGFLETLNIPYTCSGLLSSAIGINKALTKNLYYLNNIPTAPYVIVDNNKKIDIDKVIDKISDHVVVKAACEGSSIGLYTCNGKEQIEESINNALKFGEMVVIEKFIEGPEYTVAAMEFPNRYQSNDKIYFNKEIGALPVIQIIPKNEFYDFASKYDEGGSEHICPAHIDEKLATKMKDIAINAFNTLHCSGVARTDFIVDKDNQPWALETNTLPGMTSKSLVPDAARAVGIEFEELCNIIVEDAIA